MRHFRPMLAQHDITEQQWRVIRVLAEGGRLDATEAGNRAVILGPSLTRIIRVLEDRKLIVRDRDASDGRRVLLELTPKGRRFMEEIVPHARAIYKRIEDSYGVERLESLLDLLAELSVIGIEPVEAP